MRIAIGLLLILLSTWVSVPAGYAASQAQTTIAVEIQPMAVIEAPSVVYFRADSDAVEVPLNVKVRLNRRAIAELTYGSEDISNHIERDIAFDLANTDKRQFENIAKDISNTPTLVGQFVQSGVFKQTIRVKVPPQIQETMLPIMLHLRLTMNDHSGEWLKVVYLHPQPR